MLLLIQTIADSFGYILCWETVRSALCKPVQAGEKTIAIYKRDKDLNDLRSVYVPVGINGGTLLCRYSIGLFDTNV